ncbi:hypothetical protein ZWY2020_033836 [Hordeum vulgare]|nr:hypothetical protein ZWY2020_033836 [Hordeum vulgare]
MSLSLSYLQVGPDPRLSSTSRSPRDSPRDVPAVRGSRDRAYPQLHKRPSRTYKRPPSPLVHSAGPHHLLPLVAAVVATWISPEPKPSVDDSDAGRTGAGPSTTCAAGVRQRTGAPPAPSAHRRRPPPPPFGCPCRVVSARPPRPRRRPPELPPRSLNTPTSRRLPLPLSFVVR